MKKRKVNILYWHIRGHDSSHNTTYEWKVKKSCFSETQIRSLLMTLAAKEEALTCDEIVGAYAKNSNNLLSVEKDGLCQNYRCGHHACFTAKVIRGL